MEQKFWYRAARWSRASGVSRCHQLLSKILGTREDRQGAEGSGRRAQTRCCSRAQARVACNVHNVLKGQKDLKFGITRCPRKVAKYAASQAMDIEPY